MARSTFPVVILPGLAAAVAISAGLVHAASVEPAPAYAAQASSLEASTIAATAKTVFSRADLDNDQQLSQDEYVTLAIVTAELARLNGFVPVDYAGGVRVAPLAGADEWSNETRARIEANASRDYASFAGEDGRLDTDEFIGSRLEALSAADRDRNGVLTGVELQRFAAIEARVQRKQS
ncbi:MAG: hypothetical protein U5J99_02545 [Parvularculaceae bacterium]|nr:hypothetical protein [Parvularculaceae bacterium]